MDTTLFVMVVLGVGGLAFAFYMDWLGLWVGKKEMKAIIDKGNGRMQELVTQQKSQTAGPG